jgi:hypothetical protein
MPLDKFGEYGYQDSPDVITSLELERLTNATGPTEGHLVCPSTGKEPKKGVHRFLRGFPGYQRPGQDLLFQDLLHVQCQTGHVHPGKISPDTT